MRVALLSHNAQAGDAIGNSVALKLAFFRERGAAVRVFIESNHRLHPDIRPFCHLLHPHGRAGEDWQFIASADLIVVEYGQAYPLLGLLPHLVDGKRRILFDYHGVTPAHLWDAHNHEAIAAGQQQRGMVWFADAVLVHSRFTFAELVDHTAFPAQRVHRLQHPVSPALTKSAPAHDQLRARSGPGDATVLLFVGRLAPNKRVPVLIEAVSRLRGAAPPVHAVIIGDTSDAYQAEAERCRERAAELGVVDRVHLLGRVGNDQLRNLYRTSDVFVMPSRHEGFCVPIVEAMANGLPVIAARAGALPETVGDAGLTFVPDDADDLARQVRRILGCAGDKRQGDNLQAPAPSRRRRIAIVVYRFGRDFAGGAETSLGTMATSLLQAGHCVEVFTTCVHHESDWTNRLPAGTTKVDGLTVHRFPVDAHDAHAYQQAVQALVQEGATPSERAEGDYVAHSLHSQALVAALRARRASIDVIITGPYSLGLTHDVVRELPERTLVVPCFHDEPLARLAVWRETYSQAGGIFYHSPEEQDFAQSTLGLNHPRSHVSRTLVDVDTWADAGRGHARIGCQRFVVYCGRYSAEKGLPELIDFAQQYLRSFPDRFRFVFMGQGVVPIPHQCGFCDLGFVDESVKRDVLAGAAALLQLSTRESLSIVAIEALAQGTPVVAARACPALAGLIERSGGGQTVDGFAEFAAALNDLWEQPDAWRALGHRGRAHARAKYGLAEAFTARLTSALAELDEPLHACMRRRGQVRAAQFDEGDWRREFGAIVEAVLDAPARPRISRLEVEPRAPTRTVTAGFDKVLIPVRLTNRGTVPALADGPAHTVLRAIVGQGCGAAMSADASLPALVMPGQMLAAAAAVPVPNVPGVYAVSLSARRADACDERLDISDATCLTLVVQEAGAFAGDNCCTPMLDLIRAALAEAAALARLPVDYTDVCVGWLAALKRWIKRKLLGNFKRAYVDVLSRQQSACNEHMVAAVRELAECVTTLEHARRIEPHSLAASPLGRPEQGVTADVAQALAASVQRCSELEERVRRLEALMLCREQSAEEANNHESATIGNHEKRHSGD